MPALIDTDLSPVKIDPVRCVALVVREGEQAADAAQTARSAFELAGVRVIEFREESCNLAKERVDLIIALGGDGTVLRALRCAGMVCPEPVAGINFGSLGFLTMGGPEFLVPLVIAALRGELVCETRTRLAVQVYKDGVLWDDSHVAYNDVVIKVGSNPRLLDLRCDIGNRRLATYKADGLIVSTPMGSTAYNLAAGGPIVCPDADAYAVTAISAHSLTHRPVVVGSRSKTRVTMAGPRGQAAFVSVDGQPLAQLEIGDYCVVCAHETPCLVVPPTGSVFDALAAKLGWDGGNGARS